MDNWAKTLLSVYRYLDKIAGAIDTLIKKKCIYSSFACNRQDIYGQTDKIISLMNRKISIINLKVITEQALSALKPIERKVLILTYVDNVTSNKVAEVLGISIRSFFRTKSNAVHAFGCKLKSLGYSEGALQKRFGAEQWISHIYNRANRSGSTECISTNSLVSSVIREINGPKVPYYNCL